jgi:hypothetical protein
MKEGAYLLLWHYEPLFSLECPTNKKSLRVGAVFPDDGTGGFIKFQDSNKLYNVYDAGNFATGLAYSLVDDPEITVKIGAHANNVVSGRGRDQSLRDSKADQQAIHDGHNYKGVTWKK